MRAKLSESVRKTRKTRTPRHHSYREPFDVRYGAAVRTVLALGGGVEGRAVMPGGQSGRFYSRHYDDQLAKWLAGEYDELPRWPEGVTGPVLRLE